MNDKQNYATVASDDGVNYRDIANTMTLLGYKMNHSSARNYVLRIMRTIVEQLSSDWDHRLTNDQIDSIAKSPQFQSGVAELLHEIWDKEHHI